MRVVRLARLLRLISELRVLVRSISNSVKSLGWTVVLLSLLIYAVSLFLTELVADHVIGLTGPGPEALRSHWGSMPRSALSLFMTISGGIDWFDVCSPLMTEIHESLAVLMVLYVAFSALCMMNVVTGIFVEAVLRNAKEDKESHVVGNVREMFNDIEDEMDLETFLQKMENPMMEEFLQEVGVSKEEVEGLFILLDGDESGTLSPDEFLAGCLKLRGSARCLEMAVMMREVGKVSQRMKAVEAWAQENGGLSSRTASRSNFRHGSTDRNGSPRGLLPNGSRSRQTSAASNVMTAAVAASQGAQGASSEQGA